MVETSKAIFFRLYERDKLLHDDSKFKVLTQYYRTKSSVFRNLCKFLIIHAVNGIIRM